MESLLLQAFEGKNKTVPVWLMRQAGRFLPEYRAIRQKHSLDEMFATPEIAADITCLPVNILNVDAAILFADILTLPINLGFDISFVDGSGPVIRNPLQSAADLKSYHDLSDIPHLRQTIQLVNKQLSPSVPLIGFAGAPFTVLSYLIEGGSSAHFRKTIRFMNQQPKEFRKVMDFLTKNTIRYLRLQKEAGIKVFQLFDTWGGILRATDYEELVLPYVRRIFTEVNLPSIYYLKNSYHLLPLMGKTKSDFLSVCETVDIVTDPVLRWTTKGIQGNLYCGLLYADDEILKKEVLRTLKAARRCRKYIFNLSHGIFPDVDVDKVRLLVDTVHSYSLK